MRPFKRSNKYSAAKKGRMPTGICEKIMMNKQVFTEQVLAAEQTMYRVAKSILANDWDCEDAVQEAVTRAYSRIGSLKNEDYFKTWLIRILINECYRLLNKRKNIMPIESIAEPAPESGGGNGELYAAIQKLDAKSRAAVVLHYIEGYSTEETGKMLKIPQGTVKSRLSKARRLLREELK